MCDATTIGTDAGEPFLLELASSLRETFGVAFAVWSACDQSPCLLFDPTVASPADGAASAASEEFKQALLESVATRAARIYSKPPQRRLLIPVPRGGKAVVVATGAIDELSDAWALRMAKCFLESFENRRRLRDMQCELHSYASQVTESFEELTFLHGLAECLEIGDTFSDRWQTARSVFPFLRLALRAESLRLAPVGQQIGLVEGEPAAVETLLCDGARVLDDDACRRLIRQFCDTTRLQPVVRNRLDQDEAFRHFAGLRSFIVVPIVRHGRVYGWLLALNRLLDEARFTAQSDPPSWGLSDLEFGSNEAGLMVSAASVFAACARNVELLHEKENLLVGVVRSLVSAIEARDLYTFGHSERVGLTAQRLGEQLGLSRQHCRRLYLTGLLHDVGKIGISDQLLRKPGKLTPLEEEQVKKHTELGYSILRDLEQLSFVLPGVLHHHERYDGGGYPQGRIGEEIPLDARIIAVADAYDAMVSDRPYRARLTDNQAESRIREGANKQFDPRIVEALFAAINEIRTINRAYQLPAGKLRRGKMYPAMTARESVDNDDVSDLVLSVLPPP